MPQLFSINVKHIKISEPYYAKTGLKIFVTVIPKEGLPSTSQARPSFGMTLTTKYNL